MKFKFILVLFIFGCNVRKSNSVDKICFMEGSPEQIPTVSFEKLRASEGQIVRIKGTFHFDFEDVALYPNNSNDPSSALWLDFSNSMRGHEEIEKFRNKTVEVVGIIRNLEEGHLAQYFATLDSVFCIRRQ